MFPFLTSLANLATRTSGLAASTSHLIRPEVIEKTAAAGLGVAVSEHAANRFASVHETDALFGKAMEAEHPPVPHIAMVSADAKPSGTKNIFEQLVVPVGPLGLLAHLAKELAPNPIDHRFVGGNEAQPPKNEGYLSHPSAVQILGGEPLDQHWLPKAKGEYLSHPSEVTVHSGAPLQNIHEPPKGYQAYVPSIHDFTHLSSLPPHANTLIIGNGGYTRPLVEAAQEFFPRGKNFVTTRDPAMVGEVNGIHYVPTTQLADITPQLLHQIQPQVIFASPNYFGPDLEKAVEVNVKGMQHLIASTNEYAKANPGKNIVFVNPSSHSVWKEGYELTERSPSNGTSPYSLTKAMSEGLARQPHESNLAISTLRLPSTIGAMRKDEGTLIHGYIREGIETGKVTIYEREDSMRPYGNVWDTSKNILTIATHPESRVTEDLYVLAPKGGGAHTAREIADTITQVFEKHSKPVEIKFSSEKEPLGGHRSFSVNSDLAWGRFDLSEQFSLADAVERVFVQLGGTKSSN